MCDEDKEINITIKEHTFERILIIEDKYEEYNKNEFKLGEPIDHIINELLDDVVYMREIMNRIAQETDPYNLKKQEE